MSETKTATEYSVIGEADLDTVPITRVGWSSPETFASLKEAEERVAWHRLHDPDARNVRIEKRQVTYGPWTAVEEDS